MKPKGKLTHQKNKGTVFIVSLILILIFSTLSVSMVSLSGSNVQLAENQCKINRSIAAAESGFNVTRYWLSNISIPGTTSPNEKFYQIACSLQNILADEGITNIDVSYNGSSITILDVTLDSENGSSFSAVITPLDTETLQIDVTGAYDSITRTVRVQYGYTERGHTAFDFGVATKGPLSLSGNVELEGYNVSVEASVYIESDNSNLALSIIGNSQVAGNVGIANPIANVDLQGGKAGIGGETGQEAIDNHVDFGIPPSEFPEPDPGQFESYATTVIDVNTDTSSDATYENVRIAANTNPAFTGNVALKGIVYIETPNVVEFAGNANITGLIIGDGSVDDDSGENQIHFSGNVTSHPVIELAGDAQFDGLQDKTGTFVMAPGFHVSFGGNFNTLCGAIAANGIEFYGNAGGIINGSIINFSDEEMLLSGNSSLYFNRSGTNNAPAGFVPEIVLEYKPDSYSELML